MVIKESFYEKLKLIMIILMRMDESFNAPLLIAVSCRKHFFFVEEKRDGLV